MINNINNPKEYIRELTKNFKGNLQEIVDYSNGIILLEFYRLLNKYNKNGNIK